MTKTKQYVQYKYKVEMTYIDSVKNRNTKIRTECIKSLIIDHNYDVNCMPILFATMDLDKALVDNMIINMNTNLFIVAVYRLNNLSTTKEEVLVFRDKFTYFLSDDVNKHSTLDYNEENIEENQGNVFKHIVMGLMSLSNIDKNKRSLEFSMINCTMYDCVRYCTSHYNNLVIEPFSFNETNDRIILPPQNSVNSALRYLNSYRVFYYTPYRFYEDLNYTYLISSSGRAIPKKDEKVSSILIRISDIQYNESRDVGMQVDPTSNSCEILVNYADTTIFDNTLSNKSRTKLRGISTNGVQEKQLTHTAPYLKDKVKNIRLFNDNDNTIYNLEADSNSKNVIISFSKNDLDMELLTINKKISVKLIDRYKQHNGEYLLYRKKECLIREDERFSITSIVNLRKIDENIE